MNKRMTAMMALLATFLLAGCAGSPPPIKLNVNGTKMDGVQGAYCWDGGLFSGTVCVDPVEPVFDASIPLQAGTPIQLNIEKPFPDTVILSLSNEVFGEAIVTETVPVLSFIRWVPAVDAGEYILTVHATWAKKGDVSYWFKIRLDQ